MFIKLCMKYQIIIILPPSHIRGNREYFTKNLAWYKNIRCLNSLFYYNIFYINTYRTYNILEIKYKLFRGSWSKNKYTVTYVSFNTMF